MEHLSAAPSFDKLGQNEIAVRAQSHLKLQLSTYVLPSIGIATFVFKGFDIESKCWGNGVDVFPVELLQDGGFPGVVEAKHQNSDVFLFFLQLPQYG